MYDLYNVMYNYKKKKKIGQNERASTKTESNRTTSITKNKTVIIINSVMLPTCIIVIIVVIVNCHYTSVGMCAASHCTRASVHL